MILFRKSMDTMYNWMISLISLGFMVLNHPKCGIQPFKIGICRGYHGGSPLVSANNLWMLDIVVFNDQNVYGLDVEKPAMHVPSRNLSHNYGLNHPAITGKISYTWPFSIAM